MNLRSKKSENINWSGFFFYPLIKKLSKNVTIIFNGKNYISYIHLEFNKKKKVSTSVKKWNKLNLKVKLKYAFHWTEWDKVLFMFMKIL